MYLYSTRNLNEKTLSKNAIVKGLSNDGGLYCPKLNDILSEKFDIKEILNLDYKSIAKKVFKIMLSDFTDDELITCINNAYNANNFKTNLSTITPLSEIGNDYLLELYHGPTSAFKDVALTILPQFLTTAYKANSINKAIYILTATSGDTGKAALSGFRDVPNVYITVFYPTDGVSDIQRLQMSTSEGNNVSVIALDGNFDDCQRLVKEIYTDDNIKNLCDKNDIILSSANSINIGRLVPQIVYYFSSYIELVNKKKVNIYDEVNYVVPTGNFGDILAGFIAKLLGLPINKLICASNDNNVLTDFIATGVYNKNRNLFKTISPSMDILISSNLERLIFLLSDSNAELTSRLMNELKNNGCYQVDNTLLSEIKKHFVGYYASEKECMETIKYAYENDKRLIDTHTAVAYACLKKYKADSSDKTPSIILSTASPYKFAKSVISCISDGNYQNLDGFSIIDKLHEISKEFVPENLSSLKNKSIKFNTTLNYNECKKSVVKNIEKMNQKHFNGDI